MRHPTAGRHPRRGESGAVSAEAAMALPTLVVLTVALAWIVSYGVTQVRVVDAARETARAAARADTAVDAASLGRRVAPRGARVSVSAGPETVVARVSATVRGPGGVFARLGPVTVSSEAVAAAEPTW
ncbi:TadE family type IV pilus minor pilin [Nocardioides aequoreus]|uniref:TadE family type IV pilus minor pilin n=1 Tax=Nocardioides aequoreus TaxID=397278 RepID=UPI0004C2B462